MSHASERNDDAFVASLDDGTQIAGETSSLSLRARPTSARSPRGRVWFPKGSVPTPVISFVFRNFPGGVLVIGGRQSAYEWAALLGEHGAERVDVVHRHDVPRFEQSELEVRRPVHGRDRQSPRMVALAVGHPTRWNRPEVLASRPS